MPRPNRCSYSVGISETICTVATGDKFVFDTSDFELVNKYAWYITKQGYIRAWWIGHGKLVLLPRLLLDPPDDKFVDHVNHDPLDNRRCNLRLVTPAQNQYNRECIGVYYLSNKRRWRATLVFNGKAIHNGTYKTFEEARKARLFLEEKYHGRYANGVSK